MRLRNTLPISCGTIFIFPMWIKISFFIFCIEDFVLCDGYHDKPIANIHRQCINICDFFLPPLVFVCRNIPFTISSALFASDDLFFDSFCFNVIGYSFYIFLVAIIYFDFISSTNSCSTSEKLFTKFNGF